MQKYYKTQLGLDALKNRTLALNARQRRLLLLIGTEDFQRMNELIKRSLAPIEMLTQLKDMGLIDDDLTNDIYSFKNEKLISEINLYSETKQKTVEATFINTQSPSSMGISQIIHAPCIPESTENLVPLTFNEMKQLMQTLLHQHCGLMAKQLINRINSTQTLTELKPCQMQWLTALQETRISPIELNKSMQRINHSIQHLNLS
ncbi:hypothetical protein [Acinetobacter sp. ANC 4648]|uniref:hypothetical protein n=1 Tax=Acinetobacter sp. ANC 4648 TaxID=1977875 RepID=UPI000A3529E0|nr:hypothetical protein [Acinetobacter sp. ANC 4648]OTG83624.1 hypothetical protein B9T27_03670 [Acinetobacter sp. ANC 4648]